MPTCPSCRRHYEPGVETCDDDGAALLPDQSFALAETRLEPGTLVGEYEIEGLLGEGGFGTVYRAVHPVIGKPAAIKVLKREYSASAEMVSRFVAEARAVNQIRHKNIIDIFSFGALDDGRHYYVMELLEGITLDRWLADKGRLAPNEAIPLLRQLARALDAAHTAGIAHRDLKTENVFLTFDEGVPIAKLLDFGLAKLVKSAGAGHKTQSGMPMGTPLYMSPEQVHGREIDARTDIYSFGILAFELLSGRLPFDGASLIDIMTQQISAAPPRLGSVAPDLPIALDAPIAAMLEKDPAKRPQHILEAMRALESAAGVVAPISHPAEELAAALARVKAAGPLRDAANVSSSVTVRADSFDPSASRPPRTGWTVLVALGMFAVVGIVAGAVVWSTSRQGSTRFEPVPSNESPTRAESAAPTIEPAPSASTRESAAPVSPGVVRLRLKTSPPDAEVFMGNVKLGLATSELEIPRGDATITLTVKRAGYATATVEVTPRHDVADAVILKPARVKDYTF